VAVVGPVADDGSVDLRQHPLPPGDHTGWQRKRPVASRRWLEMCDAFGMVMDDVYGLEEPLGVFYGKKESLDTLRNGAPDVRLWIGEVVQRTGRRGRPLRHRIDLDVQRYSGLIEACRKLMLGSDTNGMSNLIYLDGEERKWVRPSVGTGQVVPDDPAMRWLVTYRPTTDWKGQLEASLIALKTLNPEQYYQVLSRSQRIFRWQGDSVRTRPQESETPGQGWT